METTVSPAYIWLGIALCAASTYLVRVLPVLIFRKPVKNPFVKSLLYYVPYAVLTAMTIPAVFYSGDHLYAILIGVLAAGITAYYHGSLLKVACIAAAVCYLASLIL